MVRKLGTAKGPSNLAGYDSNRDGAGYWYDPEAAERPIEFIESYCTHIEGDKGGEPLVLEEWQKDFIRALFGWKRPDGRKRYEVAYLEIPRGNGKSTLCAALALYLLGCDGERGAQVYSAAASMDQAGMVFRPATVMVRQDETLLSKFIVKETPRRIIHPDTNSFYQVIPADERTTHGQTPYAVIFDELHTQPNRKLWDTMVSGLVKRSRSILIAITTAGYDKSTICYEKHDYAEKVRDGILIDPAFLPVLYGADAKDDWTSEKVWKKANPNYGVSVVPEKIRQACVRAQQNSGEENSFRRLHLNQWTEQQERYISMADWNDCRREVDWSEFAGKPCYGGLDLAKTKDLTAFVRIWVRKEDGQTKFYVRPMFFMPEEKLTRLEMDTNIPYTRWKKEGLLIATPGAETDYGFVRSHINDTNRESPIDNIGYDPWNATHLRRLLMEEDGFVMTEVRQGYLGMNEPMKFVKGCIIERNLVHDGNEMLTWNVSNLEAKQDPKENVMPVKPTDGKWKKIDGIVATITGLAVAMFDDGLGSCYQDESWQEVL